MLKWFQSGENLTHYSQNFNRLLPTLISKIKWFWSELPLNMNSSLENTASRNEWMDVRLLIDLEVIIVDGLETIINFPEVKLEILLGQWHFYT